MSEDDVQPKRRSRSPSYPGLDLDTAIDRAQTLYDRERQHPTPLATAFGHLGYAVGSGGGNVTIAALKKYGLLEDKGSGPDRQVWVTDLAVDILSHPDAEHRSKAKRIAALRPGIHQKLWEEYGDSLPSDATLQWDLTRNRGFTDSGAKEFLANYRSTLAQAGLDKEADLRATTEREPVDADSEPPSQPEGTPQRDPEPATSPPTNADVASRVMTLPLPGGGSATVQTTRSLTEAEWQTFMTVVGAMRSSFTSQVADAGNESL